jgi:hypothetical protein
VGKELVAEQQNLKKNYVASYKMSGKGKLIYLQCGESGFSESFLFLRLVVKCMSGCDVLCNLLYVSFRR